MVDLENNNLNISLLAEENISSSLINENLQVIFDTNANISVKPALSYIKSGQKEISDYVSDVAEPRLSEYAQTAQNQMQNCVDTVQQFADDIVDKGFVKTADLQNALEGKQDVVSDLPTIRNGATLGATAVQPADLNGKADVDLSNITSTGKDIANWSTNVTNCITEIPQDIKLELNNGTLTLKAGSKVYVPNGAGVFDTKTYTNDSTYTVSYNGIYFIFSFETSGIHASLVTSTYSGPTAPTVSGSAYWYDTTNNKIKYTTDSGSTWQGNNISLPLAIITVSNGAISSIDQIFNGFGYIGSTVFALPGVKGLIPNGRNADGTLKSRLLTLTKVATGSYSGTATLYFGCSGDSGAVYFQSTNIVKYDPETNTTNWGVCIFGCFKSVSGVFSDYTPKTVFHALGYNDSSTISCWAMPSSRYINLTLGASGSSYTAPANGMLYFAKKATAVNQYIGFVHSHYQEMMRASGAVDIFVNTLVRKGETVSVAYTADGTGQYDRFLFIYAEGEKNV